MLGMLDDFKFEMNKNQLESIAHNIEFDYAESKRLGNHPKLQAVGKSTEAFTLSGTLLLQKVTALDKLIDIGEKKKPVVLSFVNASAIQVVILSMKMDKSLFLQTGEFLKQGFSVELKRWYP